MSSNAWIAVINQSVTFNRPIDNLGVILRKGTLVTVDVYDNVARLGCGQYVTLHADEYTALAPLQREAVYETEPAKRSLFK